jgi:hypothetical protein
VPIEEPTDRPLAEHQSLLGQAPAQFLDREEGEAQYDKLFPNRTIVAVVTAPTPELVDPVGGPPHGASCHVARSNPRCLAG